MLAASIDRQLIRATPGYINIHLGARPQCASARPGRADASYPCFTNTPSPLGPDPGRAGAWATPLAAKLTRSSLETSCVPGRC